MADLKTELLRILEGKLVTPVYQPIVSVNQRQIVGYEALIRGPSDSPLHSPMNLFDTAARHDLQARLEFVCREATICRFAQMSLPGKLFINVSPSILLEPDFKSGETLKFIRSSGLEPQVIIIELTEHQPTDDYQIMREAVDHYRSMGFQIALDDLGAGYSGLRLWAELKPEYVKIDKHFVQGLHEDRVKLNFVRSIQNMAAAMQCKVIAEGIETAEEFQAIHKIGITHAQGFYFARPMGLPPKELDKKLFAGTRPADNALNLYHAKSVAEITQTIDPVTADTPISCILSLFQHDADLAMLPVVDHGIIVGLIYRDKFLCRLFSSRYGIELHGKQPIQFFIDGMPFSVEKNTAVEQVSEQLTTAMRRDQAFVITDNGVYYGIVTVLDLLAEITRQQIHNAKHANPLTLLPGSVPTNELINRLLAEKRAFCVGYFDLDHFKPYNDVYGYSAGDNVIKAVADILTRHIPSEAGYVGHIGGDDFIVVFTVGDWVERCQAILSTFEHSVSGYYKAEHIQAGGLLSEDRHGCDHFFPLLSLSAGLVDAQATCLCQSHVDISDLACEAKKQAKKQPGNNYFINRRKPNNLFKSLISPEFVDAIELVFRD
ncbi:GGDEF domain-containing protein [Candidatus Methylomicrobium oryzae]|uniref:GGDEF domain-containing protein n=1 Tax=Candidatus Methylomicrobium oryzae TaxID=2802053 RepID=UPI00192508DC|nr:bifunctional diguanylate cyclase/phosphodiesterase [Methylomicrobium sp. RS1]MBL1265209.1 EAL and GGDEF domain-containing protein [Methylomicrobium sp. RS1]